MQDSRVWIAGLGDEGGAGSWIAAIMKEFVQTRPGELEKYHKFFDGVLWAVLQHEEGSLKYGVKKSLFYYQPTRCHQISIAATSTGVPGPVGTESFRTGGPLLRLSARGRCDWVLYRLARNNKGLVTDHPWIGI